MLVGIGNQWIEGQSQELEDITSLFADYIPNKK
jgi:hypothetical protein